MNYFLLLVALLRVFSAAAQATTTAPRSFTTLRTLAGLAGQHASTDGLGAQARFNEPHGVAVDAIGTVYVADMDGAVIRRITPGGLVSTLAGQAGERGSLDGPCPAARLHSPTGVAVAPDGTLYVADAGNHTIRRISPTGEVSTLAGTAGRKGHADGPGPAATFNAPHALALAPDGSLYVADTYSHTIRRITPAGEVSTFAGQAGERGRRDGAGAAARFDKPSGVAVDGRGLLYVADNHGQTLRRITPGGAVLTLAGTAGRRGDADGVGRLASFRVPAGVAADAAGNLYVADYFNSTIRPVTPQGEVSTVAGVPRLWRSFDGPLPGAGLLFPFGVAVGPDGRVYVAESGGGTVRVLE